MVFQDERLAYLELNGVEFISFMFSIEEDLLYYFIRLKLYLINLLNPMLGLK